MGATIHFILLTSGLVIGLSMSAHAAPDGILGLSAMNPVGIGTSNLVLAGSTGGNPEVHGLMGKTPDAQNVATTVPMPAAVISTGVIVLGAVGVGSESIGADTATGTSDLWSRIKLDESPDIIGRSIGPGRLLPDVTLEFGYNDNVAYENENAEASFFTRLKPHATYAMSARTYKMTLDYFLDAGFLEGTSGKDNYLDNRLVASVDYNPTLRVFSSAFVEYVDSHDGRGLGRAEAGSGTTQTSIDEWHHYGAGGKFAYGAPTARGRLEFDAAYLSKTYDTNRLFTFSRDVDVLSGSGRFLYRIRPKTALVFEAKAEQHDYQRDVFGEPSQDGITAGFLTGVTWQATYKTTGFAKAGYNFRFFDSDRVDTQGDFSWSVGVDWKPRTYSTVHVETAQSFAESNGTGDIVNQRNILAYWQHFWRDRISTRLDLGYQNSTFDPDDREDNSYLLGLRADYAFRRWINIGAGYRYSMVDSTDDIFGYNQNLFIVNLDLIF